MGSCDFALVVVVVVFVLAVSSAWGIPVSRTILRQRFAIFLEVVVDVMLKVCYEFGRGSVQLSWESGCLLIFHEFMAGRIGW